MPRVGRTRDGWRKEREEEGDTLDPRGGALRCEIPLSRTGNPRCRCGVNERKAMQVHHSPSSSPSWGVHMSMSFCFVHGVRVWEGGGLLLFVRGRVGPHPLVLRQVSTADCSSWSAPPPPQTLVNTNRRGGG